MRIPLFRNLITLLVLIAVIYLIISGKTMKNQKQDILVIGLGGDVMLGRLVNEVITAQDYAYPWGNLLPYIQKPDLTLVNLENTFTTSTHKVPKVFNFKADPDKIKTLQIAGIDVVNLANNHILDFGPEGLQETIKILDNAEINHVGTGMNIKEASAPVILKKNGITIGIIGYTDNEPTWAAQKNTPGTNYIRVGYSATIKKDLAALRKKVDLLIVSIHWGPNMQEQPSQKFINFAHQIIDAGADIIHGHSAHIFQGIEIYKNKLILYDTGDLVDDYRVDPILRNDRSFFYTATVDKKGIRQLHLLPTLIGNAQVNVASGSDYKESLDSIKKLSAPFGTKISDVGIIEIRKDT